MRVKDATGRRSPPEKAALSLVQPFLLLCILASATTLSAQRAQAPLSARVLMSPTALKGTDGRMHVAYELHVTNTSATRESFDLTELQVSMQGLKAGAASYKGKDLCALAKPGCAEGAMQVTIPPGGRTVLLIWLSFPLHAPVYAFVHTLRFKDVRGIPYTLHGDKVNLASQDVIQIGPPLRGARLWLATEGPGNAQSHHWGSLQSVNGTVTIAQRFAVDFVGLNDAGHALPVMPDNPQALQNAAWFGYDADVLAVADGIVRDARDGQPDNQPFANHPEPTDLTPRGLYGNFVILEIAPGIFAHYCHMRPGSLRVRIGDHVYRGDMIGQVGDSGNSAVPHLHFQISDKPTFLGSEGLPYRIDRFTLEGKAGKETVLSPTSKWLPHPIEERNSMPLDGDVILLP